MNIHTVFVSYLSLGKAKVLRESERNNMVLSSFNQKEVDEEQFCSNVLLFLLFDLVF